MRRNVVYLMTHGSKYLAPRRWSFWKTLSLIGIIGVAYAMMVYLRASNALQDIMIQVANNNADVVSGLRADPVLEMRGPELVDDVLSDTKSSATYFSDNSELKHSVRDFPLSHKGAQVAPLPTVLIFISGEAEYSSHLMKIGQFFSEQRMEYRTTNTHDELPSFFMDYDVPRYSMLVFDDYASYLDMDSSRKAKIDEYCVAYSVGILAFSLSTNNEEMSSWDNHKLKLVNRMTLRQYKLNPSSAIWRTAKASMVYQEVLPSSDWTIFITEHETYTPLVFSTLAAKWTGTTQIVSENEFGCIVAVHDLGHLDNIQKILIGYSVDFWLNDLVAMDAVSYLTGGKLALPMDRLLQIDIDDMFVGKSGIRTLKKDAEDLVRSQEKIRQTVPDFRYVLGFSGSKFQVGTSAEREGEKRIVELAENFLWFDHMYKHEQSHMLNSTRILRSMTLNKKFAEEHGIPVMTDYMVMPHHSGVYPVHEPLYDAWAEGGTIRATSTEEYPRQSPHWGRRGFIYRGIMAHPSGIRFLDVREIDTSSRRSPQFV